jgi:hypothetical protein
MATREFLPEGHQLHRERPFAEDIRKNKTHFNSKDIESEEMRT